MARGSPSSGATTQAGRQAGDPLAGLVLQRWQAKSSPQPEQDADADAASGALEAPQQGGSSSSAPTITYADVSRGIQHLFKERQEPMSVSCLEATFMDRYGASIPAAAGIPTRDYLRRKQNVFDFDEAADTVFLQRSMLAGPPIADPNLPKDEGFVLDEFERLIEDLGPICYVSALCGKFIQRNGVSVSSVTSTRPLDLLKRYPERFLIIGGGNVSITRFSHLPQVQEALPRGPGKAQKVSRAAQDAQLPVPEVLTEQDVVDEFRRLIQQDGGETVYISSLCGRFLQRFRKPVTQIINSRPADFLRKYPEVFELVGGGHVRLRPHAAAAPTLAPPLLQAGRRPANQPAPKLAGAHPGGADVFLAALKPAGQAPCLQAAPRAAAAPPPAPAPLLPAAPHWPPPTLEAVGAVPAGRLDDALCDDLLRRFSPPGFCDALAARVQELCTLLRERSFLRVEEMVVGGSIGKGLAMAGADCEAQLVLLVDRLPGDDHERWLPHVLETLLAVLEMALGGRARSYRSTGGCSAELALTGDPAAGTPDIIVRVVIAPCVPGPHALICDQLRAAAPPMRGFLAPALARYAVELISQQPPQVRAAMKLLRWWADRQRWPSPRETPPGYLLELMVLLAASQGIGSTGVAHLLEAALDLCSELPRLRVLWEGTAVALFPVSGVCPSLLSQTPLVVDPTNPCTNVADPAVFDARTLAMRASRGASRELGGRWSPFCTGAKEGA